MAMLVAGLTNSSAATSIVRVRGHGHGADPGLLRALRESAHDFAFVGAEALQDPRLVHRLGAAARRHGVDVIHSHLNMANASSRLAGAVVRVPHISTIHAEPTSASEDTARRIWADGLTARLSTRIVGVSPQTAELYARKFRVRHDRVLAIPNGAAPRRPAPGFDRARKRAELVGSLGDEARIVLCAARLDEAKGIGDLIRAAGSLRHRVPALRVLIAGQGPHEQRFRQGIADAGLDGVVRLLGHRDDMGDLLASADVFCLPSHSEGLPTTVLEAMHAGVPCVATAVGGTPFLVRDGETGLLTPAADPERLTSALAGILTDGASAARMAQAASAMVMRSFTPAAMTAAYAALYRELATAGRAG